MKCLYKHQQHHNTIPIFDFRQVLCRTQEIFYYKYHTQKSYPIEYSRKKGEKIRMKIKEKCNLFFLPL